MPLPPPTHNTFFFGTPFAKRVKDNKVENVKTWRFKVFKARRRYFEQLKKIRCR